MYKLLVTGAAGFIAPHIIEEASKLGWEVLGIDTIETEDKILNKNVKYLKKDARELNDDDIKDFDFVAHMAFVTNIPFSIKNPIIKSFLIRIFCSKFFIFR